MTPFELIAAIVTVAAVFSYLNHTVVRLPPAIGLMALTLIASLLVVIAGRVAPGVEVVARQIVADVDFNQTLLQGMLGFLLFAGALHIKWSELAEHGWTVLLLSTAGVLISTAVVGLLTWALLSVIGIPARPIYCFLFGALISPTDPIAVLGILRKAAVPKDMELKITGESLFNDGVGVAVFLGLLEIAQGGGGIDLPYLAGLFLREAVGGALFGLVAGWLVYRMLRLVDHYQVEVLLSLALVAGGYALANRLHLSGPIAMVVAGLLIGNHARTFAMSPTTVAKLDEFWELVDEFLNAVLFVLIGLEVLVVTFTSTNIVAGVLAIPIVLAARLVSVAVPIFLLRRTPLARYSIRVLTWGGLRGGISVALALSLPSEVDGQPVHERDVLIGLTYVIVVFSILVQGLTIGPLARRWLAGQPHPKQNEPAPVADAD